MAKKSFVFGTMLLSVILVLVPSASAQPPWNVGDSWAYKWEKDYSSSGSLSLPNATISGTHEGKAVYAYYVEYAGMENEYYRFNFHGVHYSWANVDITYQVTSPEQASGHMKLQQKTIWVEYYGYFYLKEKNITTFGSETHTVYAVYKLDYTVYSKEDVEYSALLHAESGNNVMDLTSNAKGSFNISLVLDFEAGIPFLPADEGSYSYFGSTECSYSGHAKANVNGKWNISGVVNGTSISLGGNVNINANKDYSGITTVWYNFYVNGNTVTRAGFLTNIGTKVLDHVGCHGWDGSTVMPTKSSDNEPDVKGFAKDTTDETTATYDPSKGYYTSESNEYGNSQSTDKSSVNAIVSNPKGTYGSYTAPSSETGGAGSSLLLLLIVAAVIIVVVIAVVVGVVLMRKKKQPPLAQQSQQAYAMPPQSQQPQYPQQQYPQPQPPVDAQPIQPPAPQPPQPKDSLLKKLEEIGKPELVEVVTENGQVSGEKIASNWDKIENILNEEMLNSNEQWRNEILSIRDELKERGAKRN